jgi:hypothetical protein
MKIRHKNKTYEYDQTMMVVKTDTRDKIKMLASQEKMSMKSFVDKLVEDYKVSK